MNQNLTSPAPLNANDFDAAFAAILADPTIPSQRRQELIRSLTADCILTPEVFQKLCAARPPHLLPAADLKELFSRAWLSCRSVFQRERFLGWMDLSGANWPKLLGEEFFQALVHHKTRPPVLTPSQQKAWAVLEQMSDLYFSKIMDHQTVRIRTSVLIAGPSGIGKTRVIQDFAAANGLGYLALTFGNWIVRGGRGEATTFDQLGEYLNNHDRCILHLDELDKLYTSHRGEWSTALYNELYALLDRSLFGTPGPRGGAHQRAADRLRHGCMLVGTGTWQDLWDVAGGARPSIGFGPSQESAMAASIRAARVIPTELLNRFCHEIVLLEPMRREDFASFIAQAGLDQLAESTGVPIDLDEAVQSGLGMRWIEGLTTRICLRQRAAMRAEQQRSAQPSAD
jgi:hypothetical protein